MSRCSSMRPRHLFSVDFLINVVIWGQLDFFPGGWLQEAASPFKASARKPQNDTSANNKVSLDSREENNL